MHFKVSLMRDRSHDPPVACVGWSSTEEVYSVGDDNKLVCLNVSHEKPTTIAKFDVDMCPVDLHFLPRTVGTPGKLDDSVLLTSANGKFHVINRNGRIERTVEAHKGTVLAGQWSNDGSSLLTAGEDGHIKIWSRGGMLRSTVVQSDASIRAACWAPDDQSIVYAQGRFLAIKHLAPNTKPTRWRAHDGLVLCAAWSAASNLIVSGAEDCQYRVWDDSGRSVYSSALHDHPITAVAWSPDGDLFAVGSYNTLRLCDALGWSHSLAKPDVGCVYKLRWSDDGTQIAGACANGHVLLGYVVGRRVSHSTHTATVADRKTVTVRDLANETSEVLDLPESVMQIAMKYGHLVMTTAAHCYIYKVNNWNTPDIIDLKDGPVALLLLCEKHMLLVERATLLLYNYQGRLIASPRRPNTQLEHIRGSHVSLASDTLVIRDARDPKIIHALDLSLNRSTTDVSNTVRHVLPVTEVELDQAGPPARRNMAILDDSGDLYIMEVRSPHKAPSKLGSQVRSFHWNIEENMLAAIQDVQLVVWYFPTACFSDGLLLLSLLRYDSPELGRRPRINRFAGNLVEIRRADGSLVDVPVSPFPALLHRCIQENKWEDALRLCRSIGDKTLWTGLAVLATRSGNNDLLEIAEEAYAKIDQYSKVYYIQHIKGLPDKSQQTAGAVLLAGSVQNSESILLVNGLVFQAILNHVRVHNWNRALELALKHKVHVDTVLYLRQKYLNVLQKEENNPKFLSLREKINIEKEKIQEKLGMDDI